jgi:cyclophilin family peptidyl-prolyl cis-trans isomerase/HEAT repeat protein
MRSQAPLRRLALLCSLALAAGCASAPPPASTPAAAPAAAPAPAARDLEARSLLLLMSDRRLYDPVAFQLMLSGPPETRRALAVALGRIGDRRGRSLLQGLLVDADLETRRAAAFALGQLGDADAVRALIAAAVDPDSELGALAVEALGKLGAPLADVRRAMGALSAEEGWRRLAPFLFRFHEPAMTAAAIEGLASADPLVRSGCAYALGRQPQPEAAEALRGLLSASDPWIRSWAARGLGEVGGIDDLARLEPLLADAEAAPAIAAMRAGAKLFGRVTALSPLEWDARLTAALADPRPQVRATALETAGAFLPNAGLEAELRSRWQNGEPRERELALLALAHGRVADAAELAGQAAGEADRDLRARAAEAAADLGDADLLERLAKDPEPPVRVAALEGLAARAGDDAGTVAESFLADADVTVRATALDLLARHPAVASERLAVALDAARQDRLPDARLAGVRALAARGQAVAGERAPVIEALRRLAEDPDWLVRREAAAGLRGLGQTAPAPGPLALGHDTEYYREVLLQTAGPRWVEVQTERGAFRLELDCPRAPLTTLSFLKLAAQGFFDGQVFHRVVPGFVVQAGDPRGDGWGGPGYTLRDEVNRIRYVRGTVGMALSGPDTGGSQFFVTLAPQPHLDGTYTAFGKVVAGDDVLDRLRQGDRILAVHEVPAGAGGVR